MINHLGGLRKEFHHIKTNRDDQQGYEPAMVILHHGRPGRSFIIPLEAFWKYANPIDKRQDYPSDIKDFQKIVGRAMGDRRTAERLTGDLKVKLKEKAMDDMNACAFASALWNTNKILPCVGWNLFKMMQMFDIEPSPQTAAQLLLFIEDGLDELKNMPDLPPEKELVAGEVTLFQDGSKIASKDMGVTETDLIIEEGEA